MSPTGIRPQDLPELRAELLAHIASRRGEHQFHRFNGQPVGSGPDLGVIDTIQGEELRQAEYERLAAADLFFVSTEMTQLAREAAASVPRFDLMAFDLPSPSGFMLFAEPFATYPNTGKPDARIQACSWELFQDLAVWVTFYSDWHGWLHASRAIGLFEEDDVLDAVRADHWLAHETFVITPLADIRESDFASEEAARKASEVRALDQVLRSAWLLMQQPLAELSDVQADRAARKRLRRIGQDPAPVRVIELRRPKHTSGEPGESGRNYTHRWITRGHWRQQWYPARQVHRPVWIAPHVKGPEGAPMIGGEKVYAWKR